MKRTTALAALAAPALLALSAAPANAHDIDDVTVELMAPLEELNDSGGSGEAWAKVTGNEVWIKVEVQGLLDGSPHAQHIHLGGAGECPDPAMEGSGFDGAIRTTDAIDSYGEVRVSLTGNDADTSEAAALDVSNFPADGTYTYERTFEVPDDVAEGLHHGDGVVVIHGVDHNGSGEYDGEQMSDLDDSLPSEATDPALCGAFQETQMSAPGGGVETGGGSTSGMENSGLIAGGALLVAAGAGAVALNQRRRTDS
ncbi:CHRD domain-containing protein [uncultured Serinicoccus sp.]|uniref:CHRD domain-containing protein n=1 Tax=uncultured Serinicoccus sp. TaxID=735514 RepID=UPI0026111335|nr:CHRD domain-containing protein [uncultured Serinicoccus sp.]